MPSLMSSLTWTLTASTSSWKRMIWLRLSSSQPSGGPFDVLQGLLVRAEREVATRLGDEQSELVALLEHLHGVGRRIGDAHFGGADDLRDRVFFRAVVRVARVGERDERRVHDHEDLEDREEEQAGRQVLARQESAAQVDEVDERDDDDEHARRDPVALADEDVDGQDRDRVDDAEEHHLHDEGEEPTGGQALLRREVRIIAPPARGLRGACPASSCRCSPCPGSQWPSMDAPSSQCLATD